MSEAHQPSLSFPTKINEPFHPALLRLDSGEALPENVHLTQAAKRLYARFMRQQLAAQSKGRDTFRVKVSTLAVDLDLSDRTIRRGIKQLHAAELLQIVRTGRSSYYRLLPLAIVESTPQPIVDNSPPTTKTDRTFCPNSSDKKTEPH